MDEATQQELQLIDELRTNLKDLVVAKHHLETRNLLRFIRARNLSVPNAEQMFRRQIEWREEHDMDHIMEWQYPKDLRSFWPWTISGYDNLGGPILIVPIGTWSVSAVSENYYDFVKFAYNSIECIWQATQRQSQGQTTYKQFSIIIDLKGLSFRMVTNMDAVQGVLEGVKAFEANYPETLRVGLLINAPYVFELGWRLVKPFVSEHTHSKLGFLGSNEKAWKEFLLKYMEPDQVPVKYGGTVPDSKDISITEYGCGQGKGPRHANSNDYICENFMKAEK